MNRNDDSVQLQIPLPVEIMHNIFKYLSYDTISKIRQVCKQFNDVAGSFLTHGFYKVQERHTQSLKKVKDDLPRRESERRKHYLYPKHDALQGLDTRLSLLKMTYTKYIVAGLCCFIPGKVLDEIFHVLNKINLDSHFTSVTSLLQEVRDISSMAMEHFDDVIAPHLVISESYSSFSYVDFNTSISMNDDLNTFLSPTLNPVHIINKTNSNHSVLRVNREQKKLNSKVKRLNNKLGRQHKELVLYKKKIATQVRKIKHLQHTVTRQGKMLEEMKTQLLEMSVQMSALQSAVSSETDGACAYITSPKTRLNSSDVVTSADCSRNSFVTSTPFHATSSAFGSNCGHELQACFQNVELDSLNIATTTRATTLTRKRNLNISDNTGTSSSDSVFCSAFSTTSKRQCK